MKSHGFFKFACNLLFRIIEKSRFPCVLACVFGWVFARVFALVVVAVMDVVFAAADAAVISVCELLCALLANRNRATFKKSGLVPKHCRKTPFC